MTWGANGARVNSISPGIIVTPLARHELDSEIGGIYRAMVDASPANRRFWPIRCGQIDLEALRRDRDQLWAEAMALYRQGAIWWLDDPELIAMARAEQEERYQSDAWDGLIDRWLAFDKERVNYGYGAYDDWREVEVDRTEPLSDVSVSEVLRNAIGIEPGRWTRADQMRVTAYLKARGWTRYQTRVGSAGREWRYRATGPS